MDAVETGRSLAARHLERPAPPYDEHRSLLNYAESPRVGDWTLRSSLVRLAQPDPVRVGDLLSAMRRLDAPLHHVARTLQRQVAACDPSLDPAGFDPTSRHTGPVEEIGDVRTADLARLVAAGVEGPALIAGYEELAPLDEAERMAVPLLEIAVRFEALSEVLAAWADVGPGSPPLEAVDEARTWAWARMDELGVPIETGPPPGGRGRTRG